ncbi:MAG: hypothetical protein LBG80_11975 [Bacteroidales bacterium]|jgi:hypothetical protein|nr:hypothetical protein [Bacteroidales bacterium]
MRKNIFIISVLAAIGIAAVVFNFCTKQTKTATESDVHSNKVQKDLVTSERITISLGSSNVCVILELICTEVNGNCIIDGNIYKVDCDGDIVKDPNNKATYHIVNNNDGNGWSWGSIPQITWGIPLDILLGLVNHPDFPVSCCGSGGINTPCNPVRFYGSLETGECIVWALQCCNGQISGEYYLIDCIEGVPLVTGVFCATYIGSIDNPNEYNDPNKWQWCGDSNTPDDIMKVISNSYLTPCVQ